MHGPQAKRSNVLRTDQRTERCDADLADPDRDEEEKVRRVGPRHWFEGDRSNTLRLRDEPRADCLAKVFGCGETSRRVQDSVHLHLQLLVQPAGILKNCPRSKLQRGSSWRLCRLGLMRLRVEGRTRKLALEIVILLQKHADSSLPKREDQKKVARGNLSSRAQMNRPWWLPVLAATAAAAPVCGGRAAPLSFVASLDPRVNPAIVSRPARRDQSKPICCCSFGPRDLAPDAGTVFSRPTLARKNRWLVYKNLSSSIARHPIFFLFLSSSTPSPVPTIPSDGRDNRAS
ncbi:hypothetical protein L1887_49737 [Cichorium endivia]|nr:hypothetical protein L1887_49737 [Cichorium endivia]